MAMNIEPNPQQEFRLRFVGDHGQQYYDTPGERGVTTSAFNPFHPGNGGFNPFRPGNGAVNNEFNPFQRGGNGAVNNEFNPFQHGGIAYSVRIEPLVIADYDSNGKVVGIEFLDGNHGPVESYLKLAARSSRGPVASGAG